MSAVRPACAGTAFLAPLGRDRDELGWLEARDFASARPTWSESSTGIAAEVAAVAQKVAGRRPVAHLSASSDPGALVKIRAVTPEENKALVRRFYEAIDA